MVIFKPLFKNGSKADGLIAMVTYNAVKIIATCSPMIGNLCNTKYCNIKTDNNKNWKEFTNKRRLKKHNMLCYSVADSYNTKDDKLS